MSAENTDMPSHLRDVADKSLDQARGAVNTLLDAARKASESIQTTTGTADLPAGVAVARGFGFAQQNIAAIFDFAQQLVRAPDLKNAVQLQADFVKSQATIMEQQVAELKSVTPPKEG